MPPENGPEPYQIGPPIGSGGGGTVYKAWDTARNRPVAFKRLAHGPAHFGGSTGRLVALRHPALVEHYASGSDDLGRFVVTEFAEGETLEAAVGRGPFSREAFCLLARQALDGIGALHNAGLVHCDLKPSNVMLVPHASALFQVKILDFGLVRPLHGKNEAAAEKIERLVGSVFTLAPEQFERHPVDARTDLYALGCVFYFALTGTYPFEGDTAADVMISHLRHLVPPLQDLKPDLSPEACDWVMRLISLEPNDRPTSAAAAWEEFLRIGERPAELP
jgi:serine/threonine protein kinase